MTLIPNLMPICASLLSLRLPATCIVCRNPAALRCLYCPRCRKFGRLAADDQSLLAIREALIRAWNAQQNGFICHYTGIKLEELDFQSPWYLTFDHRIPDKSGDLVVAALWVNRMKTYLTEEEFRAVVRELANHIRSGSRFNKAVVDAARYRISAMRTAPRYF